MYILFYGLIFEYYRFRYLTEIFGDELDDLEVECKTPSAATSLLSAPTSATNTTTTGDCKHSRSHHTDDTDAADDVDDDSRYAELQTAMDELRSQLPFGLPDSSKLLDPSNYTTKTRSGKPVRVDSHCPHNLDLVLDDKHWDVYEGVVCTRKHVFGQGKSDITLHIQTQMESKTALDVLRQRFAKRRRDCSAAESGKEDSGSNPSLKCDSPAAASSSLRDSVKKEEVVSDMDISDVGKAVSSSSLPLPLIVAEHLKTEQNSSCSSDSGIVLKHDDSALPPTASDVISIKAEPRDIIKCEAEESAPTAAVVTSAESVAVSGAVGLGRLLEGRRALDSVKSSEGDGHPEESDKLFLSRLKRKWEGGEVDNEEYRQDETPFCLMCDSHDELARRCVCIANILRSLSFIPGNDREMSHHSGLIRLVGKLLLFRHRHNVRGGGGRIGGSECGDDDGEEEDGMDACVDSSSSNNNSSPEWWWPTLDAVREDILVLMTNITGQMNLSVFSDTISMPVLDGLLHWSVCPSAYAQDPMPAMSPNSVLSPRKLVIEALAKLCVTEVNVDLILATAPFSRIVNLLSSFVKCIADDCDPVLREFSIAILSYLVQGDCSVARVLALQHPAINLLLDFIETADTRTAQFYKAHGQVPKTDASELLGTSIDMLRKAAKTLSFLALVPENQALFLAKQERILSLVMSTCLDGKVVEHLSDVLFSFSRDAS